ncbi:FecR family protein, partial [Variovorax atrisoli]|uniref:FecR family protein n=1 Tax=Variovorax atrisoli TaxID=3394203 RepID=UPI00403FFFDE
MTALEDNTRHDPAQLEREARVWLRLLTSGRATERDAEAFRRWRSSSPQHEQAFADARQWAARLDEAASRVASESPELVRRMRMRMRVRAARERKQESDRPVLARRAFVAGAAGVVATAAVAVAASPFDLWPAIGEWSADYRTGTGEQRRVALNDRVSVELNTQTAVSRLQVDGRTVGIELVSGEAAVDLLGASQRFAVKAGTGRSVATGGRFQVRHIDGATRVTCLEGALRIEHPLGARELSACQQIDYDAHSLGEAAPADPALSSAWRDGILVFHHTPLTQVIDEINRYRPGRVVLLDGRLSKRAVTGRFAIRELDTVIVQIQHTYDLRARRLPGGL